MSVSMDKNTGQGGYDPNCMLPRPHGHHWNPRPYGHGLGHGTECFGEPKETAVKAVHIHVGHNVPGYLPESDVLCFGSVTDALEALRHEIKGQQDYYYESCEGHCPDCAASESCECAWCDTASDCEAALSAIADSGPDRHFVAEGRASFVFSPPEGADMHHWALSIVTDREDCEIFADRES